MVDEARTEPHLTPATQVEINLTQHSVVVLECPHTLTPEAAARIRQELAQQLDRPGKHILILVDGITLKVLQRPYLPELDA